VNNPVSASKLKYPKKIEGDIRSINKAMASPAATKDHLSYTLPTIG
jgi:hypothetical protein